jgi:hypothetical protein
VVVDHVDDVGWTEPVEVAVGAGVDHCFDVAWLGALLDGAATPILCSYARASMMGAVRERDCLRVTSIRRAR